MPKTNALMDNLTLSTRRICSYSVVGELWAQSFGLSPISLSSPYFLFCDLRALGSVC